MYPLAEIMRYGIIGKGKNSSYKRHFGLLYTDGNGNIKLNLNNHCGSGNIRSRNKKVFQEILIVLNKYYNLEDLNKKNTTRLCQKNHKKIKKGEIK